VRGFVNFPKNRGAGAAGVLMLEIKNIIIFDYITFLKIYFYNFLYLYN